MVSFWNPGKPFPNGEGQILDRLRGAIEDHFGAHEFQTWYRDARWYLVARDRIALEAANAFRRRWIERRHLDALQDITRSVLGPSAEVELRPAPSIETSSRDGRKSLPASAELPSLMERGAPPVQSSATPEPSNVQHVEPNLGVDDCVEKLAHGSDPLQAELSFETFVAGGSARVAHAAALSVAERPGSLYNPLILSGPAGTGKTHLLQAIARHISRRTNLRVLYLAGATFLRRATEAAMRRSLDTFHRNGLDADVLLLDGIEVVPAGSVSSLELRRLIENRIRSSRQLVLSTSESASPLVRFPQATGFDARVLCAKLEPADIETRLRVLCRRALRRGCDLPPDVAHSLAYHFGADLRELEGAFHHLLSLARSHGGPLTLDLARRTIEEIQDPAQLRAGAVGVDRIIAIVAQRFELGSHDLVAPSKVRRVARARHIGMYLARELTPLSLTGIGAAFRRDHSTVLHGIRSVADQLEKDAELAGIVSVLRGQILERPVL